MDARHPDVVGGEEMLQFVFGVANPVTVELEEWGVYWRWVVGR